METDIQRSLDVLVVLSSALLGVVLTDVIFTGQFGLVFLLYAGILTVVIATLSLGYATSRR